MLRARICQCTSRKGSHASVVTVTLSCHAHYNLKQFVRLVVTSFFFVFSFVQLVQIKLNIQVHFQARNLQVGFASSNEYRQRVRRSL
jgi:hypothetical protein